MRKMRNGKKGDYSELVFAAIACGTASLFGFFIFFILEKSGAIVFNMPFGAAFCAFAFVCVFALGFFLFYLRFKKNRESLESIYEAVDKISSGDYEVYLDDVSARFRRVAQALEAVALALKRSEETKNDFINDFSHELKTPLTSIKGFNEMISLNTQDSAIASYSAKIGKETDRMLALLSDMLNISKLENSTAAELHPVDVDIREVAEEAADDLKMQAESKKITLKVSGNGIVRAEREHIYELVKNLAENGIRYNNEGGSVEISVQTRSDGGVRLTVRDNGIGVDPENQSRIFERFYRVDKSRSRATGGTGLGLSIVKHICDIYGASIALTSKIGVGTTIRIDFKA